VKDLFLATGKPYVHLIFFLLSFACIVATLDVTVAAVSMKSKE